MLAISKEIRNKIKYLRPINLILLSHQSFKKKNKIDLSTWLLISIIMFFLLYYKIRTIIIWIMLWMLKIKKLVLKSNH